MATMPCLRYSSSWLREKNSYPGNITKLASNTYQKIKDLNLLRPGIKTTRGKRAGKWKHRQFDIVTGVNKSNLTAVKKCDCDSISSTNVVLGCVNVRSIRNKTHEFVDNIITDNYDICMITETWLDGADNVIATEATPGGYSFDYEPRRGRTGGGVGLLCKQEFKITRRITRPMDTFEFCEWTLNLRNEIITVVVVYRPPYTNLNRHTISDFTAEFGCYLESLITAPQRILIGGDFNIHMDSSDDNDTRKFNDLLSTFTLVNHVHFQTHTGGHTLDLILTRSNDNLLVNQPEAKSFISDHCFIRTVTSLIKSESHSKQITFRRINNINLTNFKSDSQASELFKLNGKSVHEKAATYDQVLAEILDAHAPMVSKTIKIKNESPWYNNELRTIKIQKRKAEKKWIKSRNDMDYVNYRKMVFEYINQCKLAKTTYYSNKVLECSGNQHKLYKLIRNLTDGERRSVYPDSPNDQTLSEGFSDYFIDKIDRIMNDITDIRDNENISTDLNYQPNPNSTLELVTFKPLSDNEILKLINKSKTKSSMLDPIPTALLKQCTDVIIHPISDIVNSSLASGEFPNCWKCPLVSPLLKKVGLEPIFKNYRPVSCLSFVSKILEKAGLEQYNDYLEAAGLSIMENSAYKTKHSTETLLTKIQCDILNNMDQQKVTVLVMLDLSAAFDTVDVDIINEIFSNRFNIGGHVLNWFNSYLRDRGQRIRINEALSHERKTKFGVPQGSCAGPVVFLGYLSSLYDTMKKHLPYVNVGGYADDHQLYIS